MITGGLEKVQTSMTTTEFDPMKDITWLKKNPIPSVDPEDLKSAFNFQKEVAKQSGSQTRAISVDLFQKVLKPGANVQDALYRLMWLEAAKDLSEAEGLKFPWSGEGRPSDAVFKALATLTMRGMPPGPSQALPFDLEELIRLIHEKEEV
jgi:hypothetical protein